MSRFEMGDQIYALQDLYNDHDEETGVSAIPGVDAGARGVVVNVGHAEAMPEEEIYLVRFEGSAEGLLSQAIGCLAEELTCELNNQMASP